jgi:aspartyl aminopeptidase
MTAPEEEAAYAADFVNYLNAAASTFHCVSEVKRRLSAAGYVELDERRVWNVEKNGKYFVSRNGSSLIAFAVGGAFDPTTSGFLAIGAHTDSPCPKLKPISSLEKDGHVMLGVVGYGGGIWHSWFDRDLTVVGRALVKDARGVVSPRLVNVQKAIARIPTLAIHLSQDDERTAFKPNLQNHFPPLLATKIKEALWKPAPEAGAAAPAAGCAARHTPLLMSIVAKSVGCAPEDIVDFELQLGDTQPSAVMGACDEFVSSGRLDNQGSCYMATAALIESTPTLPADSAVRMVCMYDHEEVGSLSAQGADSPFFAETMARVASSLGADLPSTKARSFQISSDMAHAVHPNYSDRHDPANKPRLHGGLVLKHNANQRYATNALGASLVRRFAEIAKVSVQEFAVKADSACGTTIGPITAGGTGIRTVDVGPPQLSMHSCRELMATSDVRSSVKLFVAAFDNFAAVSRALDPGDGPDAFWTEPGNGWGNKTA